MLRRLHRFCALWLVTQILMPFTAPFPICDLSELLGQAHHHDEPIAPVPVRADEDYAYAPPLVTTAGRLRLVVVSALEVSNVAGTTPTVAPDQPLDADGLTPQHSSQTQPTVLRL